MGLCCCLEELALLAFGTTCCRCVNGGEAPCLTSACREVSSGGREWGNTLLDAKARGHLRLGVRDEAGNLLQTWWSFNGQTQAASGSRHQV